MEPRRAHRTAGLVLVLTALLAAVVLPRSFSRSLAGSPTAAPVPGPPAVGDCARPPDGGWHAGRARGALSYPPTSTGPCAGDRSGEVIAVIPAAEVARPAPAHLPGSSGRDANSDRCAAALNPYLGLEAAGSPAAQTSWAPLPTLATAVAGPTPRQRAFGQHWLGCIAYVTGVGGESVAFDRSLRAGYTTGRLPRSAARCLATADPQVLAAVPCSTPHLAELFGSGWTATPVTALLPTCLGLVRHLTGMVDPTAGGALSVQTPQQRVQIISVDAAGAAGSARATGETSVPVCLVAVSAHHALAGPLVDLGTSPVPWA